MAASSSKTYEWDPSQIEVLSDSNDSGVLLIESVPGAGKTQLLIELVLDFSKKESIIVSLTNSVRVEITDRIKSTCIANGYNYDYDTSGNHNSFTVRLLGGAVAKATKVHIATTDSWVNQILEDLRESDGSSGGSGDDELAQVIAVNGNDYAEKRRRLLAVLSTPAYDAVLPEKSILRYSQIIIDEVQDLDHEFYCIMLHMAQKFCCSCDAPAAAAQRRRMVLAGDPDQNVFAKADYCIMEELERAMTADLKYKKFFRKYHLKYNHRCPPAHIDFANAVMRVMGTDRVILCPENKPAGNVPVLVEMTRRNDKSQAETVVAYIRQLVCMGYDLADIAILAPQVKKNFLYGCIEEKLKTIYGCDKVSWIYSDSSSTEDNNTPSIDWEQCQGKLVLSSIHANKGKTHRIVMALHCLTDGHLPRNGGAPNARAIDIKAQACLLLVSMTRATDRLFMFYSEPVSSFIQGAPGLNLVRQVASCYHIRTEACLAQLKYRSQLPNDTVLSHDAIVPFNPEAMLPLLHGQAAASNDNIRYLDSVLKELIDAHAGDIAIATYDAFCAATGKGDENWRKTQYGGGDSGALLLPEIFETENLGNLYRNYVTLYLLYCCALKVPLMNELLCYCEPVRVQSHTVKYVLNRATPEWDTYVVANGVPGDGWFGALDHVVHTMFDETFAKEFDSCRLTIKYTVDKFIKPTRVKKSPRAFMVIVRSDLDVSLYMHLDVSVRVLLAAASTPRSSSDDILEALWNLSIGMKGEVNMRPWLTTYINNPPVSLRCEALTAVYAACNRFADQQLVKKGGGGTWECAVPVFVPLGAGFAKDTVPLVFTDTETGKKTVVSIRVFLPQGSSSFFISEEEAETEQLLLPCVPDMGRTGGSPYKLTSMGGPSYKNTLASIAHAAAIGADEIQIWNVRHSSAVVTFAAAAPAAAQAWLSFLDKKNQK